MTTGHNRTRLKCTISKSTNQDRYDGVAFFIGHLIGHIELHQHIVTFRNAKRIEIAKHIGACNFAHHIRIIDQHVSGVCGLDQR